MGINGLWDVIGEGSVESLATISSQHFQATGRPFRIAVDEAGWRFHNLDDFKIAAIREKEPRANPKEKAIFHRIVSLLHLHIELLFVFDGPRRPWKRGRPSGGVKYERIALLTKVLDALKVPHHRAPAEAEAEYAKLQQRGIVDAVWSEDGDTLMFGCSHMLRTYRDGGKSDAKSKTHVRVHRSADVLAQTGLDRNGLILFALLSGGLNGCGPLTAVKAARQGLGTGLSGAYLPFELDVWRAELQQFLSSRARANVNVPLDFPSKIALRNYRDPIVSSDEELAGFYEKPHHRWGRPVDEDQLSLLAAEKFNISGPLYNKHIDPIFLVRCLARSSCQDHESNRSWEVRVVRARGREPKNPPTGASTKIKFLPKNTQGFHWKEVNVVECETLQIILERGLPKDVLESSSTSGRRRKAGTSSSASKAANDEKDTIQRNSERETFPDDLALGESAAMGTPSISAGQIVRPRNQKRKRPVESASDMVEPSKRARSRCSITAGLLEGLPSTKYSKGRPAYASEGSRKHPQQRAAMPSHTAADSAPVGHGLVGNISASCSVLPHSREAIGASLTNPLENSQHLALVSAVGCARQNINGSLSNLPKPRTAPGSAEQFTSPSTQHLQSATQASNISEDDLTQSPGADVFLHDVDAIDKWNEDQLQKAVEASLQESHVREPKTHLHQTTTIQDNSQCFSADMHRGSRGSSRDSKPLEKLHSSLKPAAFEVIDLCGE
ncbi:MAG: hypothetical protein Q9162_001728 [Coniocarpon cinnabarinum]